MKLLTTCIIAGTLCSAPLTAKACEYIYGGASVTYMTESGSSVVYRMYQCGSKYKKEYFDLDGEKHLETNLVPSTKHQINEILEGITGKDLDINGDIDDAIHKLAIERGIL